MGNENIKSWSSEQLPVNFEVSFIPVDPISIGKVKVLLNGNRIGDVINDNSKVEDYYRFHDIFHFTFASFLRWSPCTRAMLNTKRKSNPELDEYEDGARATITEEAISLMLFSEAKKRNYFKNEEIPNSILSLIKEMTKPFEVSIKSKTDWKVAITKGYELFQNLILHKGGKVTFNSEQKQATFSII